MWRKVDKFMARKQPWKSGDIFAISLNDGTFSLGQVLSYEPDCMNSAFCSFYSIKVGVITNIIWQPNDKELIAVLFVTRESLDKGSWKVVGHQKPINVGMYVNLNSLREKRFLNVEIEGSKIVDEFLNAYHGLTYWNDFHDPEYLDKLLLYGVKRPEKVLFTIK
jgi:Immunity protein 26